MTALGDSLFVPRFALRPWRYADISLARCRLRTTPSNNGFVNDPQVQLRSVASPEGASGLFLYSMADRGRLGLRRCYTVCARRASDSGPAFLQCERLGKNRGALYLRIVLALVA
jgi:hypothetical protein